MLRPRHTSDVPAALPSGALPLLTGLGAFLVGVAAALSLDVVLGLALAAAAVVLLVRLRRTSTLPGAAAAALTLGAGLALRPGVVTVLVLVGVLLGAALLVRDLSVLLHLLTASVFVESIGVGSARIGRLLAVAAALAVAWRLSRGGWSSVRGLPARTWLPAVLFASLAWTSGLWADSPRHWAFAMGQLLLALAYFAAFAVLLRGPDQVRALLRTYVFGALAAACLGIYQGFVTERAVGLQGDANLYALYQVAAIAAVLVLARSASAPRAALGWYAAVLPLGGSVVASESRGGLLAVVAVVLVVLGTGAGAPAGTRRPVRAVDVVVVSALVGVLGWIAVLTNARLDPQRIANDRASGRIDIWLVAWRSFLEAPLTGLGGGQFKHHSIPLLQTTPGVELVKSHLLQLDGIEVHNVYLETATEYGVPGFLLYCSVLVCAALGLRRASAVRPRVPEIAALLPMLAAFATAAVFLSVVNNKLLWMLVGLSAALHRPDLVAETLSPSRGAPDVVPVAR